MCNIINKSDEINEDYDASQSIEKLIIHDSQTLIMNNSYPSNKASDDQNEIPPSINQNAFEDRIRYLF